MNYRSDALFDSIESAQQYVQLLAEVVLDVKKDLENDSSSDQATHFPRRQDAIRLALYNLDKLQRHMTTSSRILNDLRSLRRLLLEERQSVARDHDQTVTSGPNEARQLRVDTDAIDCDIADYFGYVRAAPSG